MLGAKIWPSNPLCTLTLLLRGWFLTFVLNFGRSVWLVLDELLGPPFNHVGLHERSEAGGDAELEMAAASIGGTKEDRASLTALKYFHIYLSALFLLLLNLKSLDINKGWRQEWGLCEFVGPCQLPGALEVECKTKFGDSCLEWLMYEKKSFLPQFL